MKNYDNIKALIFVLSVACMAFWVSCVAMAQEPEKKPDVYEQAEMEADRLQKVLDLEDWQVFYVDSTLKHDFPAMKEELEKFGADIEVYDNEIIINKSEINCASSAALKRKR